MNEINVHMESQHPDSWRELEYKERFINEILQLPMNLAVI